MKKILGDLWTTPAQVKVVPTNGDVSIEMSAKPPIYRAVMGAGVAKQARDKWPVLTMQLGSRLNAHGNQVYLFKLPEKVRLAFNAPYLMTMPTKEHWAYDGSLPLIAKSAEQMSFLADALGLTEILLPAVGTGHAKLNRATVLSILQARLDDRFTWIDLP